MSEIWLFKILSLNPTIFLTILIETLSLFFNWKRVFILSLIILLFFQYQTTTPQSLILLENDEQRVQQLRIKEYNPSSHYVRVIFHRLNLINFLEGDINTAITRLQRNFFESLDLNIYFFAGHPRERVWANDFEKLPYFLVVPFLLGLYKILLDKKYLVWISFIAAILLLTVIGHKDPLGEFILLPALLVATFIGLFEVFQRIKKV